MAHLRWAAPPRCTLLILIFSMRKFLTLRLGCCLQSKPPAFD